MIPRVGVDMLYYAILTQDDSGGVSYGTPVRIHNLTNVGLNFNAQFGTFFADDGPRATHSQIGEVDVNLTVGDLTGEQVAALIGANYNSGTGLVDYAVTASAPEVAIGFRSKKSNGHYRYMWMLKGVFGVPDSEFQTQEGSINFQPQSITGKFMGRMNDDRVFRRVDTDDDNFVFAGLPDSWFVDPDATGGMPAAMAVSTIDPAEGAAGVALASTIDITFDADVRVSDVKTDNFTLYDATAESYVTCAVGVDAANDALVIMTPSADMTTGNLHVVTVKKYVRNVDGGAMAEDFISTFTTA